MYHTFDGDYKRCTIDVKGHRIIVVQFVGTQFKLKGLRLNYLAHAIIGRVNQIALTDTILLQLEFTFGSMRLGYENALQF